jgi:hypothetical protein
MTRLHEVGRESPSGTLIRVAWYPGGGEFSLQRPDRMRQVIGFDIQDLDALKSAFDKAVEIRDGEQAEERERDRSIT